MTSFAQAEAATRRFAAEFDGGSSSQRNEATTRLQLVDRLLFECLGWSRTDAVAEERIEGGYTDYSLSAPVRLLIVEAKKEGDYFEIPAGVAELRRPISFFRRYNAAAFAAIEQCARYCQQAGTPYGAVTNGWQLIAFVAVRSDGVPPLDGDALVFPSPAFLAENFLTAWNALSPDGLRDHRLLQALSPVAEPPPSKLSERIANYPGFKGRNKLQTDLQILSDFVMEDVARLGEREDEFLRACYAPSGALTQYAVLNKAILEARYEALEEEVGGASLAPANTRKGLNPELLDKSLTRRPILIVGDVGVGKTMFLRHFIRIDAGDIFSRSVLLYIDLGSQPTFLSDLSTFMAGEIQRQLLVDYGVDIDQENFVTAVYDGELRRFEKGIFGVLKETDEREYTRHRIDLLQTKLADRDEHIRSALEHIVKGRKQQVIVVIDNVDQRPYDIQQAAFLTANGMAATWPASVYLAIRPETYYESRRDGALTGYHPKAFTVAPPRINDVIDLRLTYAIDAMSGGDLDRLKGISLNLPSVQTFLEVVRDSFRTRRDLIEFIVNMCGSNVRLALEYIKIFIGSGHVNTAKILAEVKSTGRYHVPLHEFLRAIIYGDSEQYDPKTSEVTNVYDISSNDGREHFLLPIVLAYAERKGDPGHGGYCQTTDLIRHGQQLGYTPSQVTWAIGRALSKKLLERPTRVRESADEQVDVDGARVRITTTGSYYWKHLIYAFTYVDAVVVDTPITDQRFRGRIPDVAGLGERLDRVEVFRAYLDSCWTHIDEGRSVFQWSRASSLLARSVSLIRPRVDTADPYKQLPEAEAP